MFWFSLWTSLVGALTVTNHFWLNLIRSCFCWTKNQNRKKTTTNEKEIIQKRPLIKARWHIAWQRAVDTRAQSTLSTRRRFISPTISVLTKEKRIQNKTINNFGNAISIHRLYWIFCLWIEIPLIYSCAFRSLWWRFIFVECWIQ